jgi:chromosome segregation ATPase
MTSSEHEQLVDLLTRRFSEMDQRFDQIDRQFGEIDRRFGEAGHQLGEFGRRFDAVETRITELRHEMLGHFDEIYRRLERLDQEYLAITQALRRIEARLTDEQGRREIVERDLAELKQHVASLQARIAVLEQRLDA